MIKRSELKLYDSKRYARPLIGINLRKNDEVVNVYQTDGYANIFIASNTGYGLWYDESEVSVVGQRALGVRAISLKDDEFVVIGHVFSGETEPSRSEEHTSELQSRGHLVCRLLLVIKI